MQIVDRQQHRTLAGEPLEQRHRRREELAAVVAEAPLVCLAGRSVGHQPAQWRAARVVEQPRRPPVELPQGGGERRIGRLRDVVAVAVEDEAAAAANGRGRLGDQAALTRPGFARDQHRFAAAGLDPRPGAGDLLQLGVAADDRPRSLAGTA